MSTPAPALSLRTRAVRGGFITLAGLAASQGLRLVSNIALSHFLPPAAFGLMLVGRTLLNALGQLSDVGIRPAVIRHARGDEPRFLDTAWTLQVIRGVALFAIGIALSFPIAQYTGEPQLRVLLPVLVVSLLLSGFTSTKLITLGRHLRLGRDSLVELGGQAAAVLASVAYVLVSPTVWALVVGALVRSAVRVALSYGIVPGPRNRLDWEPESAREIVSFGRWIFLSTLFSHLAQRADILLLMRLVPIEVLGVYAIATTIAEAPRRILVPLAQRILIPLFSEAHRTGPEALEREFAAARAVLLPGGLMLVLGVVLVAEPFIFYLYDAAFADAAWMVQLLGVALWLSYLQDVAGRALVAAGEPRAFAAAGFTSSICGVLGCLGGFALADLPGLVLGRALGPLLALFGSAAALRRHGLRLLGPELAYSALGLGLGLGALLGGAQLAERWEVPSAQIVAGLLPLALAPLGALLFWRVRRR